MNLGLLLSLSSHAKWKQNEYNETRFTGRDLNPKYCRNRIKIPLHKENESDERKFNTIELKAVKIKTIDFDVVKWKYFEFLRWKSITKWITLGSVRQIKNVQRCCAPCETDLIDSSKRSSLVSTGRWCLRFERSTCYNWLRTPQTIE